MAKALVANDVSDDVLSGLNTKALGEAAGRLIRIEVEGREEALAACAPVVAQFGIRLQGVRRDKISAWTSLDASVRSRMPAGMSKAVTQALIGRALRLIQAEGRFENGRRNDFPDGSAN